MDESEVADILGSRLQKAPRDSGGWILAGWPLWSQLALLLAFLTMLWTFGQSAWNRYRKIQDLNYRKAMRRRHGIPDNDNRPFTIAYSAVQKERERQAKAARASIPPERNVLAEARQRPGGHSNSVNINGNVDAPWAATSAREMYFPAPSGPSDRSTQPAPVDPLNFEQRYHPNFVQGHADQFAPHHRTSLNSSVPPPSSPRRARKSHNLKRTLDADADNNETDKKKSRLEDEEPADGDEEVNWFGRGTKRGAQDEEEAGRGQDKRARQFSRDFTPPGDNMDVEAEDGIVDLPERSTASHKSRGKKRARAEAGSTIGVDDEIEEYGSKGKGRHSAHGHKRRMRASDATGDEKEGDGRREDKSESGKDGKKAKSKRKSKKDPASAPPSVGDEREREAANQEVQGDVSMEEDAQVSTDPLCKGRKIGEEWELNGIKYKVGLNGQRLRQALVKKARNKFNMPQDSHHPDKQVNLEVVVEAWLTEEEYQNAKDAFQLAWQDSNSRTSPPAQAPSTASTAVRTPETPTKGKNLLWSSTAALGTSSPRRSAFRQSLAGNVGAYSNPFEAPPVPGRRVASAAGAPGADATGRHAQLFRSFSKWEKQDLEAEAMRRMRERAEEQRRKREEEERLKRPALVAAASAPTLSLNTLNAEGGKPAITPSLSFTAPSPVAPATATRTSSGSTLAPPSFSFSAKASATPAADAPKANLGWPSSTPGSTDPVKPPTATTSAPSFAFNAPSAKPQVPQPSAPSAAPSTPSGMPNFFGPKSMQSRSAAPAQPAPPQPTLGASFTAPQTKPPLSFAPPPAVPPATAGASTPFSFGQPKPSAASTFSSAQQGQPAEKKPDFSSIPPSGGGASTLFNKLGGGFPQPQPSTQSTAQSAPPNGPSFGFGKPSGPEPMTATATSAPSTASAAQNSGPQGTSSSTAPAQGPLKFNFGFSNKSSTPTGTASAAPAASNEKPVPEPVKPSFSFPGNASNAPTNAGASPAAPTASGPSGISAPSFNFAVPSNSPFGSAAGPGAGLGAAPSSNNAQANAAKSSFGGGFGAASGGFSTTPASSPFGQNTAAANPASFPFAANGAGAGNKAGEASKSAFGSTAGAAPLTTENKPPGFAFKFGAPGGGTTGPGTSSVFGGGQPSTSSSASVFGVAPGAAPPVFPFGANNASSGTGTTGGAFSSGNQMSFNPSQQQNQQQ